ncbi:ABC spermidine/putrescine transporter, inner membrane subunit [Oceaniovalibus guishaninsula JLT2003]|uniref:ABC spermidine/putrescine transporter, inner membrane subunit n=1 Tax=Oceaniovalibus guishaninsula JLT2003 TaxID=1231392 RepID=K2GL67_9RHOB|nr:ABC transporter permease [Oceaniovalibus guishaninsula]EKE43511.1 ABC spermidine/putrescine transporter, inner membrane subunit [Oceaniovalibus guishaninsula JLT2003]
MILRVYVLAYMVFLYAPIVLLPLFAFNDGTVIAFPLQGFTTRWFAELPQTPALVQSVRTSAIIAVSAALLSTILGICAARASARYDFSGKRAVLGFVMLPLVLPEIIIAVSLLVVVLALGLQLTAFTVILGHTLICMPFSIAILNGSFSALDRSLEEAAVDLGETRASSFRRVTLPLIAPGIVASLLIAFTISLDEFIIAFFLTGTNPTLPVYLWGQLRFPAKLPVVMALGTILVLSSVLLLCLAEWARRRGVARTGRMDGGFLG